MTAETINRNRLTRKAMLEQWYAEGMDTEEIARRMGWSEKHPPSTYIAIRRKRGYHLPPRMDEDRRRLIREARWGN